MSNSAFSAALSENSELSCRRPQLPPMFLVGLTSWLVCSIVFSACRLMTFGKMFLILSLVFALVSIALAGIMIRRGITTVHLTLIGVAMGVALGFGGACSMVVPDNCGDLNWELRLVLLEDARKSPYGAQGLASVVAGRDNESFTALVYLPPDADSLLRGTTLRGNGEIEVLESPTAQRYWSRGITCKVDLETYEVQPEFGVLDMLGNARRSAIEGLAANAGEQAGIMQALACGYTRTIEETGEYEHYKITGLAHLIAVSGSHLVIVVGLVDALLQRMGVSACARVLLSIGLICSYLVFSGFPVSALRAAVMSILSHSSVFAQRRSSALSAVGFCAVMFMALDPTVSLSASFVLSAGSTIGIILFSGLMLSWFGKVRPKIRTYLIEPAVMTVSSAMMVQLYSVSLFSQVPLLSLVANVCLAPLFVPSCVSSLLAALASCVSSALAKFAIPMGTVMVVPLQVLSEAFASVPYACVSASMSPQMAALLTFAACSLLYLRWPALSVKGLVKGCGCIAAAALLVFFSHMAIDSNCSKIVMLDVGQGDSILIKSKGARVLVDTGTNDDMLRKALARNFVYHLDAVVITHGDDDHCGSLEALSSVVRLDSVCLASDAYSCECSACAGLVHRVSALRGSPELIALGRGDSLQCGDFSLEVIWPDSFTDSGGNEDSLCMLVNYFAFGSRDGLYDADCAVQWTTLLTGDLEEDSLVKLAGDSLSRIDILKVGHHGSRGSINEPLLELMQPSAAIISVGEGNRYGHPHGDTLTILENAGCKVYRTDLHGDVALTFDAEAIEVDTQREQ